MYFAVVALYWVWLIGCVTWASKSSWYVTSHLGQLSLPSLWGRLIKYQSFWLG